MGEGFCICGWWMMDVDREVWLWEYCIVLCSSGLKGGMGFV